MTGWGAFDGAESRTGRVVLVVLAALAGAAGVAVAVGP